MADAFDIFGNIATGYQVEVAVLETLRRWMPTYLQGIESQMGREIGKIQPPRLYTNRNRFVAYPADQMPMCVVVSPGTADVPSKDGEGIYNSWFGAGVGMIAGASKPEAASSLSKLYIAAARAILLQKQTLKDDDGNDRASGVEWVDESYDDDAVEEDERSIRASYSVFRVKIENVVTRYGGPSEPIDFASDGFPEDHFANTINISQILVSIDEEV